MEKEEQKKTLKIKLTISLAFLFILIILFLILSDRNRLNMVSKVDQVDNYSTEIINQEVESENNLSEEQGDKYRQEAPDGVVVPDVGAQLGEGQEDVVVPSLVTPAAIGSDFSFRIFNVMAENGKFTPNKIIANLGDVIHINFTAVDADYDIVIPSFSMKQKAKVGQTKILEFKTNKDGDFLYYCESCGGENSEAKGNIIIVK